MDLLAFFTHVAGYASIVVAIYLRHRNDPLVVATRNRLLREAQERLASQDKGT
jgi:hypothetical protein